jgi:hypothetical protein
MVFNNYGNILGGYHDLSWRDIVKHLEIMHRKPYYQISTNDWIVNK